MYDSCADTELVELDFSLRRFRTLSARVYGASGDRHHGHLLAGP